MKIKSYKETINSITYDVTYLENDFKRYRLNGKFHNESGPAYISFYKNGNIFSEHYYINDELHNKNGPAAIWYHNNGNVMEEHYCLNNKFHNINGPAYIQYKDNSNIVYEKYYVFNKKFNSLEEVQQYLKFKNF